MDKLRLYIAGPITGDKFGDVVARWDATTEKLKHCYRVLSPLFGKKKYIRPEQNCVATECDKRYLGPITTDRSIVGRDHWMVDMVDVVFVDFIGAKMVSIGSVCEITAAFLRNKHIVIAMEEDNVHRHAFILQSAHTIFTTREEAIDYLQELGESYSD